MTFYQKVLNVFIALLLLSSLASSTATIPCVSLWGNSADFSSGCSLWSLKPEVSIPALQELTVCFHLKLESQASPLWTAFMYRHPEVQYAELGLGGKSGSLVVWLFGVEWTTTHIDLLVSQWYSLCLTWTSANGRPALYIDGQVVDVTAAPNAETSGSTSASCRRLAPNGTLSIGAGHFVTGGNIQTIPYTTVPGQISLFRIWGRERSEQEVTSLKCTEGDVVMWETGDWDTDVCAPLADSSLLCEWSTYKVNLLIAIIRHDGNDTELYTARDFVHQWLRTVLPSGIYLHRVSVFEVTRSNVRDVESPTYEGREGWWIPLSRRFNCLVHLTVVPSWDVAALQNEVHVDLMSPYYDPSGVLQLLASAESIQTTAVESFSAATMSPPDGSSTAASSTSETSTTTTTTASTTTTTTASTFTTSPANMSVLYFEVEVNVSMTTDTTGDTKLILVAWVNSSLPDNKMVLLGLQLLSQAQRHHLNLLPDSFSSDAVSRHNCVFQVQVMVSPSDTKEMEEQIRHMLLMPYSNGSVSIATQGIQISRILIINCSAEDVQNRKGLFHWPVTEGGRNATTPCPKNPRHYATRHCQLSHNTHWLIPDTTNCSLVVETIHDLDLVHVTSDNALDMVAMIDGLLSDHSTLDQLELLKVLQKLEDIISLSVVTPNLGQALINTISGIIASESDLLPFTNTILNITDSVGDRIVGFEGSSTLIAPAIAISVVDIVPGEFSSLTFGVSADHGGREPEVFINKYPPNQTVAFISLPSALQHSFPENSWNHSHPRVMFQFYGKPLLFKYNQTGSILDTFVVSASVINASSPIKDLDEDVKVTLYHMSTNELYNDGKCVYWNFNKNNGQGGWDDYGCRKNISTPEYTTCLCDHLTHFGVLLDVTRTEVDPADEQNLTIITYVGCGVSSLFLGITILTYTAFEKLRRDYPSQILINLSLALLGLNLVFLVNSWLSSWGVYGLCVAIAAMLHYFLLASFTWMGLEAVNMYFALVKVFNVYVPSYILKFCVLGWGIPLVICILVLVVNREAYGSHLYTDVLQPLDNSDNFCWLQDDVTFYVSVIAYGLLIFLFNIAVFVVVLIQIHHMRVNSPAGSHSDLMHELKGVTSLTLLLGLTWTTGFLTWGPARMVMLYLFSGLNSLQGLFIFVFHCLMKENVRKQWRIHLCFGQFRLDEYSEWSNSASVGVLAKPRSNPPRASVPSVYSVKSSSTDSTSASSDSSQRDSSSRRPNLGLFVNSLALPRAHRSTSDAGTLSARRGMNQTPGWRNHLLGLQELK